jgi:von Willebrand factor type A domain
MRFGHSTALSLLCMGVTIALADGCSSTKESTFGKSSGSSTGTASGSSASSTSSGPVAGSSSGTVSSTSVTSSSTTITPQTTTGSSGAGGSGNVDTDANCGAITQGTKQIPSDIFVMQDQSGSMTCPAIDDACTNGMNPMMLQNRWEATVQALNTFVGSSKADGIGIGLGLFPGPQGTQCMAATYATPIVPIAPLPGNAMAITAALAAAMMDSNTPTTPALQGAIEYARTYTMAQMGRTASILLVTDGNPSQCNPNTVATATAAATAGFTGTPSIKTFVVGMGNVAGLEQIALAGVGGVQANCPQVPGSTTCYIQASGDVTAALVAALTSISGMVTCDYEIPAVADPMLVNLDITIGANGMPQRVYKVDNMAACGANGGWFYDVNPPLRPTHITLCPQSCGPLQMTPNSGVSLKLGCPTDPPR